MTSPGLAALRPLLAQVRSNPRLQAGLVLIAALVLGWLFLVLGDMRDAQLQRLDQARQRLAQVQQLAGQEVWFERADEAERIAEALDAEIPAARSPGLAQAAFQGWLREIVDSQGTGLQLEVQAPVDLEEPTDVVRVTAVVSGGMEPRRVWQMVHRIESSLSLVTIPLISVRTDGANHRFSLTVQGYYRLPEQPSEVVQ